jgi:cell division protein FtsL
MSTNPRRLGPSDPSPDAHRRPRPAERPRPQLELVPPGAWRARRRRLRRRVVAVFGLVLALAPVFGLVLVHVELTANEERLTTLETQAAGAQQVNVRLRLQVSQLESPSRIVTRAQQLGMVSPPSILYLPAQPDGSTPVTQATPVTTPAASIQGWAASKRADTTP